MDILKTTNHKNKIEILSCSANSTLLEYALLNNVCFRNISLESSYLKCSKSLDLDT